MIISFKYKFIFIKTYKTAGSSIENYIFPHLNNKDIIAPTEDYPGFNCWGDFETKGLDQYFPHKDLEKKIKLNLKFFAHMPIWLVKERLEPLSQKINFDIFNNFYKFGVIRNPYDALVSHYYWINSNLSIPISFNQILDDLSANTFPNHGLLNFNRLTDRCFENVICDKIIKFENLNEELGLVFDRLKIPFKGNLNIFKKKSNRKGRYQDFYNLDSKKIVEEIFWKEMRLFNYKFN